VAELVDGGFYAKDLGAAAADRRLLRARLAGGPQPGIPGRSERSDSELWGYQPGGGRPDKKAARRNMNLRGSIGEVQKRPLRAKSVLNPQLGSGGQGRFLQ